MRTLSRLLPFVLLVGLLLAGLPGGRALAAPVGQAAAPAPVITMRLEGPLQPVWLEYLKRAGQIAQQQGAQAIIMELDTPGGDISLMNQIVQRMRASQIPIIVYVSPRGAMAASAGTILTLAGHASAMAPETIIGAASPVGSSGQDLSTTMQSKEKGALKATVQSLAADRPAAALQLADQMIDQAQAVSVDEAVKVGLVDIKAASLNDLLNQLNGRVVKVSDQSLTLHTLGAPVVDVPQTFMEEMLMVLANPNIVFLLLAVGIQAILIEISHPGGWIAGFTGAVCLLLATYGMGLLPVNWFGLLFLVLAFILFILDLKAPTHGALTAAGAVSFIVGGLVLFNSPNVPTFQRVSVPLVVGTGLFIGLAFFTILGFALRAQRIPQRMGRTMLIGQVGTVTSALNPTGIIQLGSEQWTAVVENGDAPIPKGAQVQVVALDHLNVRVRPLPLELIK